MGEGDQAGKKQQGQLSSVVEIARLVFQPDWMNEL